MSAPELLFPCSMSKQDTSLFMWCDDGFYVYLKQPTRSVGDQPIYADNHHTIEQARELFNWLGVMLHK